jgi:glycosyltransferase involved in cell wall biosynthesis
VLDDCLHSVVWADELIVVDMFSTDRTADVCASYQQCRFIQREDYIFGNVNFGFHSASSDWIMRLDSDERVTPELATEIKAILSGPPAEADVIEFWERLVVLGRELRHGFGQRHYRKMMFRRGTARYQVRSEHEDICASGRRMRTRAGYLHYNYTTVGQYLAKMDYYTDRDLERSEMPAKCPSARAAVMALVRAFYLNYGKRRGFRDGWIGLVDAGMRAFYEFTYWAKLRERWESEAAARRSLGMNPDRHATMDVPVTGRGLVNFGHERYRGRDELSVVITTKNHARFLTDCLQSVAWADEIIGIDDCSTDETGEVFQEFPQCRYFRRHDYVNGNMNFGFEQASKPWIMRIDSDERITEELADEIQATLTNPPEGVTGFEFWERPIILGRELRHGYASKHYRKMLWRRSVAKYRVQDSHEHLETSGIWRRSRHGYLHLSHPSVSHYLTKTNFWTDQDVGRDHLMDKAPSIGQGVWETARAFYLYYLKRRGYSDGWRGLVDASMRGFYQFTYWAKLRGRWERERSGTTSS